MSAILWIEILSRRDWAIFYCRFNQQLQSSPGSCSYQLRLLKNSSIKRLTSHPERDLSKAIDMSEEFLYNSSSGHDLESSFKYAFHVTKMRSERILHAPLEEIGSESRNGFCITGTTQVCRKVIVKCSVLKFEGK